MRDFLPAEVRRREYVIGVVKEVYERYGFEPLETPAVENIETLLGKYGEEGNQLIFKILKRGMHESTGEPDLALRYDLTVPLARVVAQYQNELPKFFKRYQIQPVWRAEKPGRGRFREFYQCDVDVLNSRSMAVEVELCSAVSEVLQRLGFNDFIIRMNHKQVLSGMLEVAGVPSERHNEILVTLDKLDKIGPSGIEKELFAKGFTGGRIQSLLEFLLFSKDDANRPQHGISVLHTMANYLNDGGLPRREGHQDLAMIEHLVAGTVANGHLRFDPSLARGLSYYTGAIMEINVPDFSGSLGGGGRYDNLVGMFSKQQIPACGFSLGLERILVLMNERNLFPHHITGGKIDVLVTFTEESSLKDIELANYFRSRGINTFTYPQPDKIENQRSYADKQSIRFIVSSSPDESIVVLKDLLSRDTSHQPRDRAADLILTWCAQRSKQLSFDKKFAEKLQTSEPDIK